MKKTIYIFIIIGIIIVAGLALFSDRILEVVPEKEIEVETPQKVVLVIDDGEGNPQIFENEFREGVTAFDLLKLKTEGLVLNLETKTYDIGIFIEAIGDKKNGEDGKYWLYYVNGEMPMVSADKKEIKPGDKVEFKFEKSPF